MGLFKKAVGLEYTDIAEKALAGLGTAVDKVFTNDEERIEAKTKLVEVLEGLDHAVLGAVQKEFEQVTARWEADAKAEGWLPKNIRPLTLGFLVVLLAFLTFSDSAEWITVKQHWVDLWEMAFITIIAAYFGSRGVEKSIKIREEARVGTREAMVLADPRRAKKAFGLFGKGD